MGVVLRARHSSSFKLAAALIDTYGIRARWIRLLAMHTDAGAAGPARPDNAAPPCRARNRPLAPLVLARPIAFPAACVADCRSRARPAPRPPVAVSPRRLGQPGDLNRSLGGHVTETIATEKSQ